MEVKIEGSWGTRLEDEFSKEYFKTLADFVRSDYREREVYPAPKNIFAAFDRCPFESVKVVLLGQDPYHGERQATGLAFAVNDGVAVPPSLQNIYKELAQEYDVPYASLATTGDLSPWAKQGVLLLNATLTVRAHEAGSHQGRGWETFTDAVVKLLNDEREHLVFMLWGNYAKAKGAHVSRDKHLVLEAPHPSPFSAASGFFGCGHFKRANEYLARKGIGPVDWISV